MNFGLNGFPVMPASRADAAAAVSAMPSLLTNLVAYWPLEATLQDMVGASILTPTGNIDFLPGRGGVPSANFGGSTQYLSSPSTAALQTGNVDCTFAGWFKADTIAGSDNQILSKIVIGTSVNFEYFIEIYSGTPNHFRFRFGTTDVDIAESLLVTGAWIFFVCWHDSVADTVNYQLNDNGVTRSAALVGGTTANANPLNIGAGVVARWFDGLIDNVGFWKRTLTSTEKTYLYNSGLGRHFPL